MSDPSGGNQGTGLSTQDTTQFLQRQFTGHTVGKRAFDGNWAATVVSADANSAVVTVTVQGVDFTFSCRYETRVTWPGIPSPRTVVIPPAGTACVVCFPANEPNGIGWVLTFDDSAAWK